MQQIGPKRIHYLLCCVLAFVIPFPFLFASVAVILTATAWAFSGQWRGAFAFLKKAPVLLGWILFYLLHIASYYYSADKGAAAQQLERKLSFLVLPIVLYGDFYQDSRRVGYLMLSFIGGLCTMALWCLARAFYLFAADGQYSHFFYHDLASGTDANAIYSGWHVVSALALLLFLPWEKNGVRFSDKWRWLTGLLLLAFLILLNSRLLIFLFVALLIPVYLHQLAVHKKMTKAAITGMGLGALLLVGVVASTKNPVSKRFVEVMDKNVTQAFYPDYRQQDQKFNNLTIRLFMWRVGIDNLNRHHLWAFGTGTGDYERFQNNRMAELGIARIYDKNDPSEYAGLNMHNMYLQALVTLGVPGFLFMCFLAFWPVSIQIRWPERKTFLIIMGIAALVMLQEAVLQTQAGVIFYVFFSVIIYYRYRAVKKENPVTSDS